MRSYSDDVLSREDLTALDERHTNLYEQTSTTIEGLQAENADLQRQLEFQSMMIAVVFVVNLLVAIGLKYFG